MSFKYVYVLPILCSIWFILTFITTYVISIYKKDVAPVFPYISDTGTWSPQSCIFGLMLNTGALLMVLIFYIRYRQVKYLLNKDTFKPSVKKLNQIALFLGITAAFGVCVVGNFQESNVFLVHVLGAIVAFGFGSVYQCMQVYISYQLYPTFGSKNINIARFCCAIVCSIAFVGTFVFAGISFLQFTGDDPTKWTKDDGGYLNHFISAVTEWILALTTMLFIFLFTGEFKKISFSEPLLDEAANHS